MSETDLADVDFTNIDMAAIPPEDIDDADEDPRYSELPSALLKSTSDSYRYYVVLRNGMSFIYESADICGEWVHFDGIEVESMRPKLPGDFEWGRGVDVRISEITLVADCDS